MFLASSLLTKCSQNMLIGPLYMADKVQSLDSSLCDSFTPFSPIELPDYTPKLPLSSLPSPLHYRQYLDYVVVPNGMIQDRVQKMVDHLASEYSDKPVYFLCVLKGSAVFFGDILRLWFQKQEYLHLPTEYDYIRVKSYDGTSSTGKVQISGIHDIRALQDKHVVIVEDIIDTGLTMSSLVEFIKHKVSPASIRVVSLLEKRTGKPSLYKADMVGFSIPDLFVVGYGMDFNEAFRDLRHLAVINKAGYEKFK
eukprot:gene37966-46124_t